MRSVILPLAAGLTLLGQASTTEAQVTFSLGNPGLGTGPSISIGQPAPTYYAQPVYPQSGYVQPGYGQPAYGQPGYPQSGYVQRHYSETTRYADPRTTYYNSGYRGYANPGPSAYERGYYGSNYVTPGTPYRYPSGGYSAPGYYNQGYSGPYYRAR